MEERVTRTHTPDEERRSREAALDETIEETFPASDPLSSDPNPDDAAALERRRAQEADRPSDAKSRTAERRRE